tara:strand:+ start:518 stop:631 length:114 start_codon:yes stop_codon:yes gene_type:complete
MGLMFIDLESSCWEGFDLAPYTNDLFLPPGAKFVRPP